MSRRPFARAIHSLMDNPATAPGPGLCYKSAMPTPIPSAARRLGSGAALAWTAATQLTFLAASSAPSPLYALYREAWSFSAFTLTWVSSSYAFALLAALLVFGRLSDHLGRRPVIVLALLLEIV